MANTAALDELGMLNAGCGGIIGGMACRGGPKGP
jgi:hypothetical protein